MGFFSSNRSILDTMMEFFKEDDWPYRQAEGKSVLLSSFKDGSGRWQIAAQAIEERKQLIIYSILDAEAPSNKRAAVAEFLTRANWGLVIGNFEMDYSDGQIRYKTSLDVKDNEDRLNTGLIKRLVYLNVAMMSRYTPGIMSVIYSDASPSDALKKIEG